MRNYTSLGLLTVALLPSAAWAAFSDATPTHPNHTAIEYVQQEGIVEGYNDGTYRPQGFINRAEFTKIIVEAQFTNEETDTCLDQYADEVLFPDIPHDRWFAPYVCVAKVNNLIDGYPDGTFRPANRIVFAESAKILANTFNLENEPHERVWYKSYVDALAEGNVIPTSIFAFDSDLTRGEMAEMVYRLHADVIDKESLSFVTIERNMHSEVLASNNDHIAGYEGFRFVGISPDYTHVSYPVRQCYNCEHVLFLNGEEIDKAPYLSAPVFSDDGKHIAYVRGRGIVDMDANYPDAFAHAIIDGVEGNRYSEVSRFYWNEQKQGFEYAAYHQNEDYTRDWVWVDTEGNEHSFEFSGGCFDVTTQQHGTRQFCSKWSINPGGGFALVDPDQDPTNCKLGSFKACDSHLANGTKVEVLNAEEGKGMFVQLGNIQGPTYKSIRELAFNNDRTEYAYIAINGTKATLVHNGQIGEWCELAEDEAYGYPTNSYYGNDIFFSPSGEHFAARMSAGGYASILINGKCGKKFVEVWPPKFSHDEKYIYYGAYDEENFWRVVERIE